MPLHTSTPAAADAAASVSPESVDASRASAPEGSSGAEGLPPAGRPGSGVPKRERMTQAVDRVGEGADARYVLLLNQIVPKGMQVRGDDEIDITSDVNRLWAAQVGKTAPSASKTSSPTPEQIEEERSRLASLLLAILRWIQAFMSALLGRRLTQGHAMHEEGKASDDEDTGSADSRLLQKEPRSGLVDRAESPRNAQGAPCGARQGVDDDDWDDPAATSLARTKINPVGLAVKPETPSAPTPAVKSVVTSLARPKGEPDWSTLKSTAAQSLSATVSAVVAVSNDQSQLLLAGVPEEDTPEEFMSKAEPQLGELRAAIQVRRMALQLALESAQEEARLHGAEPQLFWAAALAKHSVDIPGRDYRAELSVLKSNLDVVSQRTDIESIQSRLDATMRDVLTEMMNLPPSTDEGVARLFDAMKASLAEQQLAARNAEIPAEVPAETSAEADSGLEAPPTSSTELTDSPKGAAASEELPIDAVEQEAAALEEAVQRGRVSSLSGYRQRMQAG